MTEPTSPPTERSNPDARDGTGCEVAGCDVAVVGAGPAGALAARELARSGLSVMLFDAARFPRDKVCGCCLHPDALSRLNHVGLGELPDRLGGRRVAQVEVRTPGARRTFALPSLVTVSRSALDAALTEEAVAAGARFLDGTRVRAAAVHPGGRRLQLERDGMCWSQHARVVLVGDGLAGGLLADEIPVRTVRHSRLGAGTLIDASRLAGAGLGEAQLVMACGAGGYVGIARLEDGRASVAAALARPEPHPAGWVGVRAASILVAAGLDLPELAGARWTGTPALTRRPTRLAAPWAFLIGDRSGYVEPFTGEGMGWALASALEVLPAVQEALLLARCGAAWNPRLGRNYVRGLRRRVGARRFACGLMGAVLRRPRWTAALLGLAARPRVARALVRHGYGRRVTP